MNAWEILAFGVYALLGMGFMVWAVNQRGEGVTLLDLICAVSVGSLFGAVFAVAWFCRYPFIWASEVVLWGPRK